MNSRLPFLFILSMINSCIELEISAPSFPQMMQHFGISAEEVGQTISLNLLGFALASLVYGPLSEHYGRRPMMLIGNGLLAGAAIACTIMPCFAGLLVARFLQGMGAATSAVLVAAMIADAYPTREATRLYGLMNAIFSILMAASPVLGGLLTAYIGWRGNYGSVALIATVSWIFLFRFLPETSGVRTALNIKRLAQQYQHMIRHSRFLSAACIPSILYGFYLSFIALAPFIYLQLWKLSLPNYTYHQGLILGVFAVGSFFSGHLIKRWGERSTLHKALLLCGLSSILMMTFHAPYSLTIAMSLFCLGFAWIYPIIYAQSMTFFPSFKGSASSFVMGLRYLLCTVITGVMTNLCQASVVLIGLALMVFILIVTDLSYPLFQIKGDKWS